jgi:hypothetical protein
MTPMAQISLEKELALCTKPGSFALHWLAVTGLSEDLWRHVAWCSTRCCQNVELLLIHDAGQAKISDQKIGVVFRCSEKQILGLQVSVYDSMVV